MTLERNREFQLNVFFFLLIIIINNNNNNIIIINNNNFIIILLLLLSCGRGSGEKCVRLFEKEKKR